MNKTLLYLLTFLRLNGHVPSEKGRKFDTELRVAMVRRFVGMEVY